MQLLRWNKPGHDTTPASSMVRGAGGREPNPRLRRREKNVLDIPLYRSGRFTQNACTPPPYRLKGLVLCKTKTVNLSLPGLGWARFWAVPRVALNSFGG